MTDAAAAWLALTVIAFLFASIVLELLLISQLDKVRRICLALGHRLAVIRDAQIGSPIDGDAPSDAAADPDP